MLLGKEYLAIAAISLVITAVTLDSWLFSTPSDKDSCYMPSDILLRCMAVISLFHGS